MHLYISPDVRSKLNDFHEVDELEIEEAFWLHAGGPYFVDAREKNRTIPPTLWFISETSEGRRLKVVFIYDRKHDTAVLKTAYEPDEEEVRLYETNAKK